MAWVQMFLDFLAAIAWPIVVGAVLLGNRQSIGDLLPRVRRVKAAGVEAELEAVTKRADLVLERIDDSDADTSVSVSRSDIEDIVKEMTAAGWNLSKTVPFKGEPRPVIEWSQGKPQISYWTSDFDANELTGGDRQRAREIEQQILEIEGRIGTGALARFGHVEESRKLDVLKDALSKVDPGSPFLG